MICIAVISFRASRFQHYSFGEVVVEFSVRNGNSKNVAGQSVRYIDRLRMMSAHFICLKVHVIKETNGQ